MSQTNFKQLFSHFYDVPCRKGSFGNSVLFTFILSVLQEVELWAQFSHSYSTECFYLKADLAKKVYNRYKVQQMADGQMFSKVGGVIVITELAQIWDFQVIILKVQSPSQAPNLLWMKWGFFIILYIMC